MSNLPAIPEKRALYRGHEDAKLGGVCAALAHRFGFDPVWLRLVLVVSVLYFGVGILPYIILWVVIPENPKQPKQQALPPSEPDRDEVPPELAEAWKEVNDITRN